MELRFDESSSDEYQSQSEVLTENSNWPPQPLRNSNNNSAGGKVRQKRDFHFQVIQIRQGPKWFIWPSNKDESQEAPKKNGSNQENDEIQPMEQTKNEQSAQTMVENSANTSAAAQIQPCPATVSNIPNNSLQMRRTNRFSSRRKFQVQPVVDSIAVEGEMTRVTSTKQQLPNAPLSEPTTRRLSCKTPKPSKYESNQNSTTTTPDSYCSNSAPSQTFKILSISKKWESDDEDELLECSCRKMSLSLDDDCPVGHRRHIVAASGVHLILTPPPESNTNGFNM
uniref:Uncharacterized protein n=1 Tax=Acrobeloides nanus TaxID=290746 RepID=A0A914DQY6_9BILA